RRRCGARRRTTCVAVSSVCPERVLRLAHPKVLASILFHTGTGLAGPAPPLPDSQTVYNKMRGQCAASDRFCNVSFTTAYGRAFPPHAAMGPPDASSVLNRPYFDDLARGPAHALSKSRAVLYLAGELPAGRV